MGDEQAGQRRNGHGGETDQYQRPLVLRLRFTPDCAVAGLGRAFAVGAKNRGLFSGATQVPGRRRGSLGVGRDPRLGRDRAQKPVMKGEARTRKNGDAIRSPAQTAAQSIVKIVLFRQDMVPSPFVEVLSPVALC